VNAEVVITVLLAAHCRRATARAIRLEVFADWKIHVSHSLSKSKTNKKTVLQAKDLYQDIHFMALSSHAKLFVLISLQHSRQNIEQSRLSCKLLCNKELPIAKLRRVPHPCRHLLATGWARQLATGY
jgi:hypothetical protein